MVLALVALLMGVAAPRLMTWVEGARLRTALSEMRATLESLPTQAFFAGEARLVEQGSQTADLLKLPTGWRLDLPTPLRYEANGMTAGGRLRLWEGDTLRADWRVTAPTGKVIQASRQE